MAPARWLPWLLLLALGGCATTATTPPESVAADAVTLARQADGSTRLVVAADTAFDYDSSVLRPAIEAAIVEAAMPLRQQSVRILGYTDNVGAPAYNRQLSRERAQGIANALVMHGFSAAQLQVEGLGEQSPRASNETAAGRQQNRRVELLFSPVE